MNDDADFKVVADDSDFIEVAELSIENSFISKITSYFTIVGDLLDDIKNEVDPDN